MAWLRVAAGLLLAAIYVVLAASFNVLARRSGWFANANAAVALHRLLCAILGVRVRQLGAPGPERRLIAANHVSWLDVLVLGATEPMAFLAKKEIGANRLTRWLVDLQGAIYLDRTRKRCIPIINAEIVRCVLGDAPVVLFAEATTSDGVRLLPFRSSHFEAARRAQATVQPVYLNYRAIGGLRVTRRDLQTVAWYGDMTFLPSLRKVVACGGVECDVRYGDVIRWDEADDRKGLARKAEAAMRKLKTLGRK
jgi:1-acyl-sn-glycerol-3-phosphate acyltransferase